MDMKDAGRRLMAVELVSKTVKGWGDPLRSELLAEMVASGTETLRVRDDEGTNFGAVLVAGARERKARVTDETAFTQWVAQRYPTEVVQVVRDHFAKRLLDAATKAGDPVDVDTGEVMPGVEMQDREPYLSVRPSQLARELMAETLATSGVLALTAGLPGPESVGEVPDATA